ncbi:hypothetical protein CHKEEEPN_3253 [Methylorubrum podarium]|nr:hypothetical protein CHKEEEPN_3253 [Methylorubrum podarium]
MSASRLVVAAALAAIPGAAEAQVPTSVARAPTLTIERYPEDWSYLADPGRRTGSWTERFKYIPLSGDGSIYLSTGAGKCLCPGQKGGSATGSNPTDRGTPGTKRHLVTDARGTPLGL